VEDFAVVAVPSFGAAGRGPLSDSEDLHFIVLTRDAPDTGTYFAGYPANLKAR
jgi:hypothetical protein